MIFILSPSKTQQISCAAGVTPSQPPLLDQASILISLLKKMGKAELSNLMKTSEKLTELTRSRIEEFIAPHIAGQAGTALTTFKGDAFSSMDTQEYGREDFYFANEHLRILSGLYGVLKPLDLMQPYRLEMGTKLSSDRGTTLHQFWGTRVTKAINADLSRRELRFVINCASKEYSRVLQPELLSGPMITITFKQQKGGTLKSIAIYAKRARGMFVDYLIKNRIEDPDGLTSFDAGGYRYTPALSSQEELVFILDLEESKSPPDL